jgi:Tyrosine-protein kinase ephrin type A/B receptor-like
VQVRVGHSTDPLQNAVCASGALAAGANSTITCLSAMAGRYLFVVGAGSSVLVLNEVRVLGIAAAPCPADTFKPLVGNASCTACPAFSTSAVGATSVAQCSCRDGYLDG